MPDDKFYNFSDCTGNCAMGQYMTSIGEKWDIARYDEHIRREFNGMPGVLANNLTFGGIKRALENA